MGDRANCVVLTEGQAPVYLYTHWGGCELLQTVQNAIKKEWRWDDPQYLARIIFDQMTENHHGQETGFGISSYEGDNSHDLIYVDPGKQEIRVGEHSWPMAAFCTTDVSGVKF